MKSWLDRVSPGRFLIIAGLAAGLARQFCPTAAANPITVEASASPAAIIQDDDFNGLASSITLNSAISSITSVQVTVDVAGAPWAWNGDYYAYLQYGPGLVVLLNNLGGSLSNPYGSPGNGFDVTFSDAAPNISTAPMTPFEQLTGTYAPQAGSLGTFDGLDPNGTWTLFIADEQAGGVGELENWSLQVTGTVPDNCATLGLLVMGASALMFCPRRKHPLAEPAR